MPLLRRRIAAAVAALITGLPIAGCGGASHGGASAAAAGSAATTSAATPSAAHTRAVHRAAFSPPTCAPRAAAAVARAARVSRVSARTRIDGAGYPECLFTAGRLHVAVEVAKTAQAFFLLERTVTEASQIWPARLQSAPEHVNRLGIDADWFPTHRRLMTTDAVRLITATIGWPKAPPGARVALAVAVARPYLGPNDYKAATLSP